MITREFGAGNQNQDVVFGDVDLSQNGGLRGPPHNPGAGGWPTVRYYNAKTGPDGAPYVKKTNKAMCEELGDENYMRAYVEDVLSSSKLEDEL